LGLGREIQGTWIQDTGFRILEFRKLGSGTGLRILNSGCWDSGYCGAQVLGLKILRFRIIRFRILGFRYWD
jgi:hypothetical protein